MAQFSDKDFDQIEAAVLNTARGRWFLSEYARRHRSADTLTLLEAIHKLEAGLGVGRNPRVPAAALAELDGIAKSISAARMQMTEVASEVVSELTSRKAVNTLGLLTSAEERLDALIASHAPALPAAEAWDARSSDTVEDEERLQERGPPDRQVFAPVGAPRLREPDAARRIVLSRAPSPAASEDRAGNEPGTRAVARAGPRILITRGQSSEHTRIPLTEDSDPAA